MSAWTTVRVGAVSQQIRGVSYEKLEASTDPRPTFVPLLRANNITDEGLTFKGLIHVPPNRVSPNQRLRPGDLVIAASSGSLDVVGKAAPIAKSFDGTFGVFCKVLRPSSSIDPAYFAHFFRTPSYRAKISSLAAGANINNLRNEHLDDLELPLPPLSDQRRIAAILDEADALRAKRRAALAQLDDLAHAIFVGMFGDPATNPKEWPTHILGELVYVRGGKRLPKGDTYSPSPTLFRYIRVTDISDGKIDEKQLLFLREDTQKQIARYTVDKGNVIISIAGSIGLVAPVPEPLAGANLTENAAKLVAKDSAAYEPEYLAAILRTPFVQEQIGARIGQVTIGKLALFRIEQLPIPLPNIKTQRAYVQQLGKLNVVLRSNIEAAAKHDSLFASLQHRAFRGEL